MVRMRPQNAPSGRWLADVLSESKKDRKADEQREMARLWLAGYSQDEIAELVGVDPATFRNFHKSAEIPETGRVETEVERLTRLASCAGWKVDTEFADIDPPLYDVWTAKTSSNATTHTGQTENLLDGGCRGDRGRVRWGMSWW